MAYETGTATSPSDLLEKIKVFLAANGWTINLWADDNSTNHDYLHSDTTGKRLHIQKTAADGTIMYFNFRSAIRMFLFGEYASVYQQYLSTWYYSEITGIAMNGSTGFQATTALAITNIANYTTGITRVTCANIFKQGDSVVIAGTTNYNGTYTVLASPSATYFYISHSTVATETSGTATGPVPWARQPGYSHDNGGVLSRGCCINALQTGTVPNYYIFTPTSNDSVIIIVEYENGKFQYMCFGLLHKAGVYTGGQFCVASCDSYNPYYARTPVGYDVYGSRFAFCGRVITPGLNQYVFVNIDAAVDWRINDYLGVDYRSVMFGGLCLDLNLANSSQVGLAHGFIKRTPNNFSAITPMLPLYASIKRTGTDQWSLAGWIENFRQLRVDNYANADEVSFGSDTWKLFPAHNKSDDVLTGYGFAVKKVV